MTKENYLEAVNAAKRFETNNDVVKYTPEAKAEVLHLFSSNATQALSRNDNDLKHLASASLAVLKSIKTHREFIEVLRRMGQEHSAKGGLLDFKNNFVSLVLRFLYRSQQAGNTEQWLSALYS